MDFFYLKLFGTPDASFIYVDIGFNHISVEICGFMVGVDFK